MVKTRHSGDLDVESPPKFLSLTNEKSRQSAKSGDDAEDGETSGRAYREPRGAYNIFDDKVVESRLRPRIGPSRAYNYLDVDSSDEEIIRRRSHHLSTRDFTPERQRSRYTQSRQIKQEMLEEQQTRPRRMMRRQSLHEDMEHSLEDEDDEEEQPARQSRKTQPRRYREVDEEEDNKRRSGRRRRQDSVEEDQAEKDTSRGRSSSRQRRHSVEDDSQVESVISPSRRSMQRQREEEVEDEHLIRRSSRTRRQVYDTLNQSFLVSVPGRSKQDSDDQNDSDNHDPCDAKDQDSDDNNNQEFSDMYSRVKRTRVKVKRNMYGVPINDDSDSEQDMRRNKNNSKQDDDEDDEENGEDGNEKDDCGNRRGRRGNRLSLRKKQPQVVKSYSLREHKPRTDLYKAPVEEPRIRRMHHSIFPGTPTKKSTNQTYHSPAHRRNIRKRSAFHSSSSSTSSDSESSDEKSFKRRKAKSMAKARSRMMPMNFSTNALPSASIVKDRIKSGASLADVEPMNIDKNVTFSSIGGLGKHIRALKEMVVFPLLYEKVFQRFKVDPPRGVLFYGPPGTGKTLVARALANECSQGDRKVAFFMRKGADCLSKWVGESERQLRLLFDQAYKFRPSIIFFDEIDGLAPVRSSRQDQIHSSIVSTLLALMDGLDSRGEIVVIGATNRIDSLDPALRRPGRFDREFLFPLPSLEARKQILKIHTASWTPTLNDYFISELAEKCVGYCGADLKALCTEAAMLALRRRYPQIYITNEALQLDVSSINVSAKDFFDAVQNIIPTSQRAVNTPARALSARVCPLLQRQLDNVMSQLHDTFPPSLAKAASSSLDTTVSTSQAQALAENGIIWDELASDEDEDAPSIFVPSTSSKGSKTNRRSAEELPNSSHAVPTYLRFVSYATSRPATFRPRVMVVGREGQAQTTYIAPAVIHQMENLPVHVLDLPALYAVTAKTPEESCANVFHEAKRKCPSIVYLPYINQWWDVMAETLRATLLTLIQDLDPTLPLLLLATSEQPYHSLDPVLQSLFSQISGEVICMTDPNTEERRQFFKDLLLKQTCRQPPQKKQAAQRMLEVLPKAAPPKPRELTKEELKQLVEKEELTLMELRIFLRDVLNKLGSDKKFSIFAKPVNIEDAPDYYEIIEHPMDLSTMMAKIDLHEYTTVRSFMHDVDLICSNALEYNPNRGPMDRVIRHRACALKDTAYAIIKTELDKDFEKTCMEIEESRKRRGEKSATVPNFYYTRPNNQQQQSSRSNAIIPSYLEHPKPVRSIPKPEGERFSRRVRGLNIDPVPPLEAVEKVFRGSRSASSPTRDKNNSNEDSGTPTPTERSSTIQNEGEPNKPDIQTPTVPKEENSRGSKINKQSEGNKSQCSSTSSIKKRKTSKCVWCKPRRKRPRFMTPRHAAAGAKVDEDQDEEISHDEGVEEVGDLEGESTHESDKAESQPLQVDVTQQEEVTESKEEKSPVRAVTRNKSPAQGPSPATRVSTRRSSMSPRSSGLAAHSSPSSGLSHNVIETPEPSIETQQQAQNTEHNQEQTELVVSAGVEAVHPSSPTPELERSKVVKRLDLDSVAMDSGVGSSLESNGDSRDSMDHRGEVCEGDSTTRTPSSLSSKVHDSNQNCSTELKSRANAILNEPNQKVVVDLDRLTSLLNRLVARTDGCNVERLEKIYSHLSQIIYKHRHTYDKTVLVVDLERKVDDMTKIIPATSVRH